MNIELILQNSYDGKIYDISDIASELKWDTVLINAPGKLTFKLQNDGQVLISSGSIVSLKVNSKGIFFGYAFVKGLKSDKEYSITAYDQMRYMSNKDTYVIPAGRTASQVFVQTCTDYKVKHSVVHSSSFIIPKRVHDNKSLFDINQYGIDMTLIGSGNWFMMRDDFGVVKFLNIANLKTSLVIGDESLLNDFEFEESIDSDTYNKVKLIKEDTEKKKREVYIVQDSNNMKRWGTLQYFEKVDDDSNYAQIKERAEKTLKLKNRPTKTLSLPCMGDLQVYAGVGIILSIKDLVREGIPLNKYFVVTECSHSFSNKLHTMDLKVQVV